MNSLNKVQLIGNLTEDPEVRETPNGTKVATVSVATNRTWKDGSGAKQESVEFSRVTLWGALAEIAEKYLKKGNKAYLEGRLETKSWEQDGVKKYRTDIVANELIILSSKPKTEGEEAFGEDQKPRATSEAKKKAQEEISLEDIPF